MATKYEKTCEQNIHISMQISRKKVVLLTVIALFIISTKGSVVNRNILIPDRSVVITDNNNILSFDIKTENSTVIKTTNNSIGALGIYLGEGLFWSEGTESKISCLFEKECDNVITFTKRCIPQAIAVDFVTRNIYIIDKLAGTLNVIDMEGKNYGIVLTDLMKPHDLVLDPSKGLAFIVQQSVSILKVSMDGSSPTEIVKEIAVSTIAIDRRQRRIYWAMDYGLESIMSANYEGKRRLVMATTSAVDSLTIAYDRLFWLRPATWISNSTLLSCEIGESTQICANETEHALFFNNPKTIKAFPEIDHYAQVDPCKKSQCQQLCLLSSSEPGYRCTCRVGWRLNADLKTCRRIFSFLLYTRGNSVRGVDINDTSVHMFPPISFVTKSLIKKETIDFDYDLRNDSFYFSDDKNIYKVNMVRDGVQKIIYTSNYTSYIKNIAVDWISGYLYFFEKIGDELAKLKILDINHGQNYRAVDGPSVYENFDSTNNTVTHSLIVYPNLAHLFYHIYDTKNNQMIKKIMTDCSWGDTDVKGEDVGLSKINLAIDYEENRIFYINGLNYINDANMDLSNKKVHFELAKDFKNPLTIFVYRNWIFVSNLTSIWRFDKRTGQNVEKLITLKASGKNFEKISGVRVASETIQSMHNDNPCPIQFGNCTIMCFKEI